MTPPCVIFEDEHLLVADKPHFLPVTPSGLYARQTLMARLRHTTGLVDLNPVHRLDRDTSGVLVLGKTPSAAARLAGAFTCAKP